VTDYVIRIVSAIFFAGLMQIAHSITTTHQSSYNLQAHWVLSEAANVGVMNHLGAKGEMQDKNRLEALFIAASRGDLREIERLIQEGVDVNGKNKNGFQTGWTALFYAAASGRDNSAVIKLLVKHKVDINAKDINGRTALLAAMEPHDTHANIKALIDSGVDVNVQDFGGDTPLIEAAGLGSAVVVKMLLEKGANPNVKQRRGRTALMIAADLSHADVVKALLDSGADPHIRDNEGDTALALLERVIKENRDNNIRPNKYVRNSRAAIIRMLTKK
jgi:ankyrin repeat protein